MTNIDTPELDRMAAIRDQSQVLGEFLDEFLGSRGWVIAEVPDYYEQTLVPVSYSIEELLAEFFGIDLVKVEKERRAILAELAEFHARQQQLREARDKEDACSDSSSSNTSPS